MKFEGILPALVTPLTENEDINVPVLEKLIEDLLAKGADGFYIAGATGEGLALRPWQRQVLAEEAIRTVKGRKPCIVQIASTDFSVARTLAKHAEQAGADAISATAPLFFQYDEDDIYRYYKELADSVNIPVMAYYSPNAGFAFNAKFAARLFEIDNLTSIKWTSSNYYEMMELKNLTHGEMNIINGPDEMLLMGLNAGADAGIGLTYNFMPEIFVEIYSSFKAGNIPAAQAAQRKAAHIISTLQKYPLIPTTKLILENMGYEVGNCTFPMKRFSPKEKRDIIAAFRQVATELE